MSREIEVRYVDEHGRPAVLSVPPRVDDLSLIEIARGLAGTIHEREVGPWRHIASPKPSERQED